MGKWKISWVLLCCVVTSVYSQDWEEVEAVIENIRSHQVDVERIISHMSEEGKHQPYERVKKLSDDHGQRISGSDALEDAIDDIRDQMINEGFAVGKEEVQVPDLRRGKETARLLKPFEVDMEILGLGFTIGTNGTMIHEAIVVKSFEELEEEAENGNVAGKIVVFNQEYVGYFDTVTYRVNGATRASEAGAVAVLIKSVADFSLYTPHTGTQTYGNNTDKIPAACLTIEDAEMLQRYSDQGDPIEIELSMEEYDYGMKTSYNLVSEIKGSQFPDEYVIFGGHIDSWDVGTGVMDDGGGVVISWQVLTLIKELNLQPKRTMRFVGWTAEEVGFHGAWAFFDKHKHYIDDISLIMESDFGTFNPTGIRFTGSELATYYMQAVVDLTKELGTDNILEDGSQGDTSMWIDEGVPGAALGNANENYFWYHHTKADTLTMQDPDDLDECAMLWAATAYVVANMDVKLPRDDASLPPPTGGCDVMQGTTTIIALFTLYILHRFIF